MPKIRGKAFVTQVTEEVEEYVFIGDLDKASVLAALHNGAGPAEDDSRYNPDTRLTVPQARALLASDITDIKTFNGRALYIDLAEDNLITWGYDKHNGAGVAQAVIDLLRLNAENQLSEEPRLFLV
jgi:hypothetical protein